MLDFVRKKQKSLWIKIMFWIIIATFVGTGAMYLTKDEPGNVAAEVNGDEITFDEFRSAYENLRRFYQNVYRDGFDPEMERRLQLDRQVLEGLINQALLLQEADRLDIEVSKGQVVEAIAAIPAFMRDGRFDMEQYQTVLQYERISPQDFENSQRRQMLIEKMRERIEQEASVTADEVTAEYRQRNEMVNLAFVRLTPALFESKVNVTDEALQEYYQEHKEEFRIPEKVALRYVKFDPERYALDLEVTDQEIADYYRRHQAQFDMPEQAKVSHILFRVGADADEDLLQKKRQLAEKVLADIRSKDGSNFAELARKHSDDAGSAIEGGSLGYFTRGTMVPAFEDVAFSLQPGEISGIVETSFGLHILKGEGHIEAGIKPLAEVLPEVRKGLIEEKARETAIDKAMQAYSKYRESGDLEAVAKEHNLAVEKTGPFERGATVPGLGNAPEANAEAFRLEKGKLANAVILPQGIYLVALEERIESKVPELQDVRQAVEKSYRQDQSLPLARNTAEQMLAELKAGKDLQQLTEGKLLKVEETGFFPHSYGDFVPRIGNAPEMADEAFGLTEQKPLPEKIHAVSDQFFVVKLKEKRPADMSKLDEAARQDLEKVLLTRKKEKLLEDRLAALRKEADISIDPALNLNLESE
ncbi:MAG: SurA N-terminal domain-containing protein [Syntrophotaleaceae bacterium]